MRPIAYAGSPDFKVLSFRTTNVMRWEYKPGSTLFVVWQQGAEGPGQPSGFHYGQDFSDVFSTPSSNAFLVKLAYWLNPISVGPAQAGHYDLYSTARCSTRPRSPTT